jgi:hypothetical protein
VSSAVVTFITKGQALAYLSLAWREDDAAPRACRHGAIGINGTIQWHDPVNHRWLEHAVLEPRRQCLWDAGRGDHVALQRVDAEKLTFIYDRSRPGRSSGGVLPAKPARRAARWASMVSDGSKVGPPTAFSTTSAPRPSVKCRMTGADCDGSGVSTLGRDRSGSSAYIV